MLWYSLLFDGTSTILFPIYKACLFFIWHCIAHTADEAPFSSSRMYFYCHHSRYPLPLMGSEYLKLIKTKAHNFSQSIHDRRLQVQTFYLKMKNAVFWDVMSCGSCKNRCFGGTYHFHYQGEKNQQARNNSEYEGDTFLRNIGSCKSHMTSHPRKRHAS
jgi:hypothetical protein